MKKATMKDIARLANVSVATVSYVLNKVKNQTIPEATKESILQIAKELNYVPNLAARSLVKQRSGLVGILVNRTPELPYWKRLASSTLVESLEMSLTRSGYHALVVSLNPQEPYLDIIRERKLDAVFLVDVQDDMFYRISTNFVEGVPLILIDSLIEDRLFNQVNYHFPQAIQRALSYSQKPACLVMEDYYNQALSAWIRESSTLPEDCIYTVSGAEALEGMDSFLKKNESKHIIVMNELLGNIAERTTDKTDLTVICTCDLPELLNRNTRTVQFVNNRSAAALELMETLLREPGDYSLAADHKFFIEVFE
jgi:transcriptional regulator with XRE-family HTH domain